MNFSSITKILVIYLKEVARRENWTRYIDVEDDFVSAMKYLFIDKEIFYENSL